MSLDSPSHRSTGFSAESVCVTLRAIAGSSKKPPGLPWITQKAAVVSTDHAWHGALEVGAGARAPVCLHTPLKAIKVLLHAVSPLLFCLFEKYVYVFLGDNAGIVFDKRRHLNLARIKLYFACL